MKLRKRHGEQSEGLMASTVALPRPEIPLLKGDSLSLDDLGAEALKTYIKYPGIDLGHFVAPRFFGCGALGEIHDRDPNPLPVTDLEPDGSFLIEIDNGLLQGLDKGYAFYSYARTDIRGNVMPGPALEESSGRLFFYINKQVEPALMLPPPHFMDSDGLVIDLERLKGDGRVVTTHYPFMTAGDNVVLSWKDEFGNSENYTKELGEGSGEPLVWVIDEIKFLIAGGWCELSYTVNYKNGGISQSPVQRFTIKLNAGQSPSLPPPVIPGHSGGWLDPAKYGDGLPVEVDDYGIRHGDELLLTAVSKKVSRHMLRIDRSILDSKRLRFLVPAQWLQEHIGEAVKLTWQWARVGGAADSTPLDFVLKKPLVLKPPFNPDATQQEPEPGEEVDPEMVSFAFISPSLLTLGTKIRVPQESETNDGKITMYWEGFGTTGKYQTDKPTVGNPWEFQIPRAVIPANFGKRVKVFYTVKDADDGEQRSPAYGLKIQPLTSDAFQAVQCPDFATSDIPVSQVIDSVTFTLNSNSWHFFAQGQIVRVYVTGKSKPGEPSLPEEVIRDDKPVSADEWNEGWLRMSLSKEYLLKLEENTHFHVYVKVSFDEGTSFVQGRTAEFKVVP
ncbi:MAG TPA: hypothetical protein DDZ74_20870 [Pseudomonas sp.]|nr:hypothetical protein [Pseudomonas sp.]